MTRNYGHLLAALLTLPWLASAEMLGQRRREYPNQRSVKFSNMSGRRVDVYWMNVDKDPIEYVSQSEKQEGYAYGSDTAILSYIGHSFEIREMPGKKSKKCIYDECRKLLFTVTDNEDQEVFINSDFEIEFTDKTQRAEKKAQKLLEECKKSASTTKDPLKAVDALTDCMAEKIDKAVAEEEDERSFQSELRASMAKQISTFACGDPEFEDSESILNRTWHYETAPGKYKDFLMQTYHERPTSKIVSISDFVDEEECNAIEKLSTGRSVPFLAVNGQTEDNKIMHSFASKMYELARVTMNWRPLDFQDQYKLGHELLYVYKDEEGIESPGARCKKEKETKTATIDSDGQVVTTEDATDAGKSCRLPGAEPLKVSTKRVDITDPELATIFVFCEEPESLGGLHFPHTGTHLNPEKGMAVIAVHRYLEDEGYDGYAQEYHMCPNHRIYTHLFSKP